MMAKGAVWPKLNKLKENKHELSTHPIPSTVCTSEPDSIMARSLDFRAGMPKFKVWLLYSLNM